MLKHTLKKNQRKRSYPQCKTVGAFHASFHPTCPLCQGKHRATVCQRFLNQRWQERMATAKRLGMCFICLTLGHRANRCKFKSQEPDDAAESPGKKTRYKPSEETTARVLLANTRGPDRVRFQTVKAIAHGANGKQLVINCLFDSGAERTLVTEDTAKALGLVGVAETVPPAKTNQHDLGRELIEALTFPRIYDDIQSVPIRSREWKHLQHLWITEEQDEKLPVHVLIGVDTMGCLWSGESTADLQCRCHGAQIEENMDHLLKKFRELESISVQHQEKKTTQNTASCQFLDKLIYDGSRYSVGLLWKPGVDRLPDNYALAERRLRSVERSLRKHLTKQREYIAVIKEYVRNGWAEEVTTQSGQPGKTWYFPHHAVYKIADGQTKCRVVFDGQYRIAVQADIEKMYLQVGLRAEDRDACRFLWRDCMSHAPPRRYRLTRVCLRLACSPYLAIKVLKAHAELNPDEGDETVRLALANMYMDDLVMSCDKKAEKWTSNRAELLDTLPKEDVPKMAKRKPEELSGGLSRSTKRQMLSLTARLYDPLGYTAPFAGQMKMLFQCLWTTALGWDALLPPQIKKRWRSWLEQLQTLSQIKISRAWIPYLMKRVQRIELYIFGDASQAAYAACAYIRVESINHQIAVNLVMVKSRVAPIKRISRSQLELMVALLCARLKKYLEKELTLPIQEITCWSDCRYWRYCPTTENPADISSRGCSLGRLINTALWWHGLPWLMQGRENWPNEPAAIADDNEHLTAKQKTVKVLTSQIDESGVDQVINPTCYSRYETSIRELWNAEARWLREVQVKEYGVKSDCAEQVREFEPFLDKDGLLRIGGGLRRSTLLPESKHPIISPHNHPVIELLIKDHHSQKRGEEDNPFMPGMSQGRCANLSTPNESAAARYLSEQSLRLHIYMHDDQSGTSRAPETANNGQFSTRFKDIHLPQRPTPKNPSGRNCSGNSPKSVSGGNSSHQEALGAAHINDRILVFMGDDISGEAALTPINFLIGRESSGLLSVRTKINRCDDKTKYVTTLTTRGRWRKTHQEPRVGDIVLVQDPGTAGDKWPNGRIFEIHLSKDRVIRWVMVKTGQRTVTRFARSFRLEEPSSDA
ncbi:hypothetical protein T10_7931 [Trichinella papuae]|uniref:DUF5641 domain-containing protein n=1 Tax=Trichinella papuae TaxID=268474 RepID=A0A0V1MV76_9BILA|nr:hypothetical protein T10_7931 [Trichinella papuae]